MEVRVTVVRVRKKETRVMVADGDGSCGQLERSIYGIGKRLIKGRFWEQQHNLTSLGNGT
jgi:hypothetical protein